MELFNQPFTGQLGNRLIDTLDSCDYHTLNIIVAFAKISGVLRLKDSFEKFREKGGKINIYVGVDLSGTSFEALTTLLMYTDSLNIVHFEKKQTFHTKIYQILGDEKEILIVGSHNLTGGGLWTNIESSLIETDNKKLSKSVSEYIKNLKSLTDSFMRINTQEDIDKLLENGYILKEVMAQIKIAKTLIKEKNNESLFGTGISAKLPTLNNPVKSKKTQINSSTTPSKKDKELVSFRNDGGTIWFETRKMTGGSRNILDLSMKSLVERGDPTGTEFDTGDSRVMRGGVEFFGLNPADTKKNKTITINFEGVDYTDNRILFPNGALANGTWRLQIKGISPIGKITETFKLKGDNYLVEKIITFTKIKDDYYSMSVFPESEMNEFISSSVILARNGVTTNSKRIGIIKNS